MELYQLEHFIAVVEEHSFTRAAERVCRTQGAVSVTIRKLEEEVGVPLMLRDPHACTLTEAGQALLEHARRIIRLRDDLQARMTDIRDLVSGRVTVATHESAARHLLPGPLTAFHLRHRHIRIRTRLCDGHQIAQLVAERDADLGFGIRQAALRGLHSEMLLNDALVLVAAPCHPLAGRKDVAITDLGAERFFMHSRRSPMVVTVHRLFAEHGVHPDVAAELADFETIKRFVAAGSGVTIVPSSVAAPDLAAGRLVAVPVAQMQIDRPIDVVYSDTGPLLPAPAALLELMRAWNWHEPPSSGD